jgi:hypothetical protein
MDGCGSEIAHGKIISKDILNHVFELIKLLLVHGSGFLRTSDHNKQFQAQLMPKVGTTASVFQLNAWVEDY